VVGPAGRTFKRGLVLTGRNVGRRAGGQEGMKAERTEGKMEERKKKGRDEVVGGERHRDRLAVVGRAGCTF
jgi:hypothetical protein